MFNTIKLHNTVHDRVQWYIFNILSGRVKQMAYLVVV